MSVLRALSGSATPNRVLVTLLGTLGRHAMTLLSSIVVARGLGPTDFGHFSFLLASFTAIRVMLDLGTSNAFYTFVCAMPRHPRFFLYYGGWLGLQFLLAVAFLLVLAPTEWIVTVWHGHPRWLLVVAFAAAFSQQTLWQTAIQIGESLRLTARAQMAAVGIAAAHFVLVSAFALLDLLSVATLLALVGLEFLVATALIMVSYGRASMADGPPPPFSEVVREFTRFCAPLIPNVFLGVVMALGDTWMLQTYGGPVEQGYYNISTQFTNLALVLTVSAVNVLWKEFSEAAATGNLDRVRDVLLKGNRFLCAVSAAVAGYMAFWSGEFLHLLVGEGYAGAAPTFVILLVNTPWQSVGQVLSVAVMALHRTKALSAINIFHGIITIGMAVLFLAVLKMGSEGNATKYFLSAILHAVLFDLYLWRTFSWRPDWAFRIAIPLGFLGLGWVCQAATRLLMPAGSPGIALILVGGVIYLAILAPVAILVLRRVNAPLLERFLPFMARKTPGA